MKPAAATAFVGRAADRDRLAAILQQVREGLSAVLVLSGDAGIGKTQLLRWTVDSAADVRTLLVSGYEAEIGLGFAALHRLLQPFLGYLPELPGPQRGALGTAFGLTSGPVPNRFLIGLGAMAVLQRAALKEPLLCAVDDAQWIDQESLDTLAFVARRLDAEGFGLILAVRTDGQLPRTLAGIPEHRLAPMPERDMRSLLYARASTPPAPHVAARLITESEGNPLALLEYLASLSPERLAGTADIPAALPISDRLCASFAAQIVRLPSAARQLLLLLAAAGPNATDIVAEAGQQLGVGPEAAVPAMRQSLLSDQPGLVFRHPLIRSVVYDSAGLVAQRQVHAHLAAAATTCGYPDAAALHRAYAAADPNEGVAAQLEAAAARARDRGGYAAEASFLTLAVQHSNPGSSDHTRRRLAAARANIIAGHGAQAEQLLAGTEEHGETGARIAAERVEAILLSNDSRHPAAPVMLMKAASDLPSGSTELARQLLSSALRAAVGSRELTVGTSLPQIAEALLDQPWPPPGRPGTPVDFIYQALATRFARGYSAAIPAMREALRRVAEEPDFAAAQSVPLLIWLLMEDLWDDEFESTAWPQLTEANWKRGALPSVWVGLASSAVTSWRHGQFDTAEALFDEAVGLSVAVGAHQQVSWSVLTEFRAWQGREGETRSMADTLILEWTGQRQYGSSTNFALMALTVLELSLGRYGAALRHARRVADDDPPGHGSRVLPDLIEAAVRSGETTSAETALAALASRTAASGTPWALSLRARSEALVLGASAEAETRYEEALHRFGATPLAAELARTQLLYGEWLRRRRRRRDACEHLTAALTAFTRMGAELFARRAAQELSAAGGSQPETVRDRRSALTAQERRIADLAARGLTNAEISEQLFISESTVDYHLSKVFRKLGISSRRRIRDKLGS